MANPDRPSGFRAVRTMSGAPVTGLLRSIGVTNGTDLFRGDMLSLASNLAIISATDDATFLGVAYGFGKVDAASGEYTSPFNPDTLTIN